VSHGRPAAVPGGRGAPVNGHVLPARALAWAHYPERAPESGAPLGRSIVRWLRAGFGSRGPARLPTGLRQVLEASFARLQELDAAAFKSAVEQVRQRLRQQGLSPEATGEALALAGCALARTLGNTPYPTQYFAAWLMLEGHFAEMATGEGKTMTAALAAGVAALAGTAVHVMSANDYLVQRDRDTLQHFYALLGLASSCVLPGMPRALREQAWQADVVYVTAKELVFDYLQDHLLLRGARDPRLQRAHAIATPGRAAAPVLPGLCMALIDEADSILLDEACVPLILSAPGAPIDEAAYRRGFELARKLQRGRDYVLQPAQRAARLTAAGRAEVAAAVKGETSALAPARRAFDLIEAALAARLLFRRDREYAVTAQGVEIIDEPTGRIATGRQWSGPLQAMIEIKEGVKPSRPTHPSARITFPRFFPRYLRLCGMSGTLAEAARELRLHYDTAVVRVPPARASRRRWLGEQAFVSASHKWQAVLARVRELAASGRPVLVGTDSVAASAHLSSLLQAAGIEHQVLNAVQDADEAAHIARAGQRGAVTVATNIAGRGTDIRLDAQTEALGGLHVIACLRNRSRRCDRQLFGRCARHGDPGSAEAMVALDDTLLGRLCPPWLHRLAQRAADADGRLPRWWAQPLFAAAQRFREAHDRQARAQLRRSDRHAGELFSFAGGIE
jgi:preprotein translocase subunit SecA